MIARGLHVDEVGLSLCRCDSGAWISEVVDYSGKAGYGETRLLINNKKKSRNLTGNPDS